MKDEFLIVRFLGAFALIALAGAIGLSAVGKPSEVVANLASGAVGALAGGYVGQRQARSRQTPKPASMTEGGQS